MLQLNLVLPSPDQKRHARREWVLRQRSLVYAKSSSFSSSSLKATKFLIPLNPPISKPCSLFNPFHTHRLSHSLDQQSASFWKSAISYYCAMHVVLARYCYRMSSVGPSVRPSVALMYAGHLGWTSSKVIAWIISLGSSLLGSTTSAT